METKVNMPRTKIIIYCQRMEAELRRMEAQVNILRDWAQADDFDAVFFDGAMDVLSDIGKDLTGITSMSSTCWYDLYSVKEAEKNGEAI